MNRAFTWLPLALAACVPAAQIDEQSCAAFCKDANDAAASAKTESGEAPEMALTSFEQNMLSGLVEDVRAGVRPFDEQSLGICPKGENPRKCDTMLGATPGELPEGEYILYGSFRVPNAGDRGSWKVKLTVECAVSRPLEDGSTKTETRKPYEREYEVVYAGPTKGYTLSPMRRITSPSKSGTESCTFTITAPHGDGAKEYVGGWTVPAAPPE